MHPNDHSRTVYSRRDKNTAKCSLIDEEIKKKIWYVYKMKYYSATKRMNYCHLQQYGWT